MSQILRHYTPIWNQIKQNLTCEIAASSAYHRRIRKAVIKEKDMDTGYKLENLEKTPPIVAVLRTESKGSRIIFRLTFDRYISLDTI